MKELWVRADWDDVWDTRKSRITDALESGAFGVVVQKGEESKVRTLGGIKVAAGDESADVRVFTSLDDLKKDKGKDKSKGKYRSAFYREINTKDDEVMIADAGEFSDYVVINALDWKVIPLENIIAQLKDKCKIIMEVKTADDARLALQTLEVGADGVLVNADINVIKDVKKLIDDIESENIPLVLAKITKLKPVGMGDRVCVDTCSMFNRGEGMLIGSLANSMFLVHSETVESEYVASRPFRVNAGPVHAYAKVPGGKTRYLSELSAGDEVLAVDFKGNTRKLIVGRSKIERRPLILIEAQYTGNSKDEKHKVKKFSTILQNAETIRLVDKQGSPVSISKLKVGDEVMVSIEDTGRHFGMAVKETIEEK